MGKQRNWKREHQEMRQFRSEARQYLYQCKGEYLGKMMAFAYDGKQAVFEASGYIPGKNYQEYAREFAAEAPWRSLIRKNLTRQFCDCAEAHVWLEIVARGKNPKNYIIGALNERGNFASPCQNCALWVDSTFKAVYRTTPAYEGRTKQVPGV
ncbi:hypothetical protein [Vibrio mediterranei]|uniref:Uncharacterized protein n=1 Tax=Vibrio mediterranei TaxID=689 RepID=A0AAN1FJI1_9VIBR|nr:hypothetical protein [Vibrio mediterranei]ASI91759.1 hypothetical protein BSZ05_18105 [Vibrio mediterranei]